MSTPVPTRLTAIACWALVAGFGCQDDLGPCDQAAAEEVVYGRSALVATKGQALVHDSCGNGAFCHSSQAQGAQRHGAPSDMDLDMLPPRGWPRLVELRHDIWAAIESGEMPPGRAGDVTLGDGDWSFDPERAEDSARLPRLSTREGKAAVRNWLACGAPVVADTTAPDWTHPPLASDAGAQSTGWSEIYERILRPSCAIAGCHNEAAAGGLAMMDRCMAYAQLMATGTCGDSPRVDPGSAQSVLLQKLESSAPSCGGTRMPPTAPLPADQIEAIRSWVLSGAEAGDCDQ